jgi:hypothetical protein
MSNFNLINCNGTLTTAYITLAAFSQSSATLYGSTNSITYFASQTVKSTLAAQGIIKGVATGVQGLNCEYRIQVGRSGDILLHSYTLVKIPEVKLQAICTGDETPVCFGTLTGVVTQLLNNCYLTTCLGSTVTALGETTVALVGAKWVKRLGHHILKERCLDFSQLSANRFTASYADFYLNFAIPVDKKDGYLQMIGDVPELTRDGLTWWLPSDAQGNQALPSRVLVIPDLFYYEYDTGMGLTMAAVPYQDIYLTYRTHEINHLLSLWALTGADTDTYCLKYLKPSENPSAFVGSSVPAVEMATYLVYVLVSNDERKSLGCSAVDKMIVQMQEQVCGSGVNNGQQLTNTLNFSHDVFGLYFALKNNTNHHWDKSNYTNFPSYVTWGATKDSNQFTEHVWVHCPGQDPSERFTICYDNQPCVDAPQEVTSLYFPYINANCSGTLPDANGLNVYSFAYRNMYSNQPNGSVAFGRISNTNFVSYLRKTTQSVISGSNVLSDYGVLADLWCDVLPAFRCVIGNSNTNKLGPINDASCGIAKQQFELVVDAVNYNPVRIAGGAIGFPLL